jgi:ubiquinone/menaquinone biosynthesis C-methylase UbiE
MEKIKLNLGCGDKIIKDYINVDIVNERGGHQPDIVCDIRKLSIFADNYSDEIMAIHVVEHFWRWEIMEVIKEWIRVLKPGGKLILECPNLLSACQELVNDPINSAKPDKAGQKSMWVFFGDPSWKDPLMIHKWGYTPQSLAQLMHECGLKDIKQEKAQFKLREPRDMRITGIKQQ